MFGSNSEPPRERRDGFAKLPRTDWATPRSMMRGMFLGLASRPARALLTASVSGRERYSAPSGDRYCAGASVWPATSAGPRLIAAAMMDVNAARCTSLNGIGPDSTGG